MRWHYSPATSNALRTLKCLSFSYKITNQHPYSRLLPSYPLSVLFFTGLGLTPRWPFLKRPFSRRITLFFHSFQAGENSIKCCLWCYLINGSKQSFILPLRNSFSSQIKARALNNQSKYFKRKVIIDFKWIINFSD